MKSKVFDVVGLKYWAKPSLRAMLSKNLPLEASLRREPGNEVDPNAIAVYAKFGVNDIKIGFLRAAVAEVWAPKIDSGELRIYRCKLISIDLEDDDGEVQIFYTARKFDKATRTR